MTNATNLYFVPVGFPSVQIKRLDFIYDFMVVTVSGRPSPSPKKVQISVSGPVGRLVFPETSGTIRGRQSAD